MSRSKTLAHYPTRYSEIVRECAVEAKEVFVPCESATQAASLRGHWYSYIGAVKAEERVIRAIMARSPLPNPSPGQQEVLELAAQSQRVLLTMRADPPGVLFQNRDASWQAKLLERSVVTDGKVVELPQGVQDAASRLMKLQKETDDGNS